MVTNLEAARDVACECVDLVQALRRLARNDWSWEDEDVGRVATFMVEHLGTLVDEAERQLKPVVNQLRGHFDEEPPKPIGDEHGASFHDLGVAVARQVFKGLWSHACPLSFANAIATGGGFDAERFANGDPDYKGTDDLPGGLRGARKYMLEKCPEFNADELISFIQGESARAVRETQPAAVGVDLSPDDAVREDIRANNSGLYGRHFPFDKKEVHELANAIYDKKSGKSENKIAHELTGENPRDKNTKAKSRLTQLRKQKGKTYFPDQGE